MFLIDNLLAAPLRGLMFVLKKIDEAVQKEVEVEERAIMADLSALHRALDSGAITEAEFDAREQELLRPARSIAFGGRGRCLRRCSFLTPVPPIRRGRVKTMSAGGGA